MNAILSTANNAGMPHLSTPPRELKIALGNGLTFICSYWGWATTPYVNVAMLHSGCRLGKFHTQRIASATLAIDRFDHVCVDADTLNFGDASFELDTTANTDALINFCAVHGITVRREEA